MGGGENLLGVPTFLSGIVGDGLSPQQDPSSQDVASDGEEQGLQRSNPYHLPRPVVRETQADVVLDRAILNSAAQSNLLIMQSLAKGNQD